MKRIYLLSVLGILTALASVVNNMFSPAMPDLVNTFGPYLESAVMGTMSIDDALAQGQAACEALLP